jgi:hypothetical protein
MARTNSTDVSEILDTSLDTGALEAYIEAASDVVDDVAGVDPSLSSSRLERIEKFFAAYLATAQDPRADSQSGESRSISYRGVEGGGNASYYETAVTLDPTGVIKDANKRTATLDVPDARGIDS